MTQEGPWTIKPHWFMVAAPLLLTGIPGLLLLALGLTVFRGGSLYIQVAVLLAALFLLQWPARRALSWAGLSYSLSGGVLRVSRGLLVKRVLEIPVNSIYNFALRQPAPMGAILNFGFVRLITDGPQGEVLCEYVPNCRNFIAKIYHMEAVAEEYLAGTDLAC